MRRPKRKQRGSSRLTLAIDRVTVEVTPGYWTYFVVDTSAIPSPLPNSLKLHFARISDQGDPDYYLRESKEPTFFQYSEKNINCDNCISDPVTEGEFSIPDLSTPKKIYLGIYGYCCDAATVKVRLFPLTIVPMFIGLLCFSSGFSRRRISASLQLPRLWNYELNLSTDALSDAFSVN